MSSHHTRQAHIKRKKVGKTQRCACCQRKPRGFTMFGMWTPSTGDKRPIAYVLCHSCTVKLTTDRERWVKVIEHNLIHASK